MSAMDFVRAFLACYFGFVALHYTARLVAMREAAGFSHADPGMRGTANHAHQWIFRVFRMAIFLVCVARVPFPGIDPWLGVVETLQHPAVVGSGVVMMIAALGFIDYVHSYLMADWRSGTGGRAVSRLVTSGPYARTRNPIFLAVLGGQIGFALALPSVFSLLCLAVGAVVILRQARVEERVLAERFGPAYLAYISATPRWLPTVGRGAPRYGAADR